MTESGSFAADVPLSYALSIKPTIESSPYLDGLIEGAAIAVMKGASRAQIPVESILVRPHVDTYFDGVALDVKAALPAPEEHPFISTRSSIIPLYWDLFERGLPEDTGRFFRSTVTLIIRPSSVKA